MFLRVSAPPYEALASSLSPAGGTVGQSRRSHQADGGVKNRRRLRLPLGARGTLGGTSAWHVLSYEYTELSHAEVTWCLSCVERGRLFSHHQPCKIVKVALAFACGSSSSWIYQRPILAQICREVQIRSFARTPCRYLRMPPVTMAQGPNVFFSMRLIRVSLSISSRYLKRAAR